MHIFFVPIASDICTLLLRLLPPVFWAPLYVVLLSGVPDLIHPPPKLFSPIRSVFAYLLLSLQPLTSYESKLPLGVALTSLTHLTFSLPENVTVKNIFYIINFISWRLPEVPDNLQLSADVCACPWEPVTNLPPPSLRNRDISLSH